MSVTWTKRNSIWFIIKRKIHIILLSQIIIFFTGFYFVTLMRIIIVVLKLLEKFRGRKGKRREVEEREDETGIPTPGAKKFLPFFSPFLIFFFIKHIFYKIFLVYRIFIFHFIKYIFLLYLKKKYEIYPNSNARRGIPGPFQATPGPFFILIMNYKQRRFVHFSNNLCFAPCILMRTKSPKLL